MPSVVSSAEFVPASKAGSCLASLISVEEVSLYSLKGVRADWEKDAISGSTRFRAPLRLTQIDASSEGARKGLRIGDVVRAVRKDGHGDFVDLKSVSSDQGVFVNEDANAILLSDGPCTVRVQRIGRKCSGCGEFSVEECQDRWDHSLVCTACGIVAVSSLMSLDAEWRTFDDDSHRANPDRVGGLDVPSAALHNTFISGSGSRIPSVLVQAHRRANACGGPLNSKAEAELRERVGELCTRMDLTGGIELQAQAIGEAFLKARAAAKQQSRLPKPAVAAACVYRACEELGVHRTVKEMLAGAQCSQKQFTTAASHLRKALPHLARPQLDAAQVAATLIPRFASHLRLQPPAERAALAALAALPSSFTARHLATSLAAAAIARAVSSIQPISAVARATGAAETTIKTLLREWDALSAPPNAPAEHPRPPTRSAASVQSALPVSHGLQVARSSSPGANWSLPAKVVTDELDVTVASTQDYLQSQTSHSPCSSSGPAHVKEEANEETVMGAASSGVGGGVGGGLRVGDDDWWLESDAGCEEMVLDLTGMDAL